jgi:hypothetical protein
LSEKKFCNSGQTADKPKFLQKEKLTKGFVKPNVSYDCGDAARCTDELFYVPGAFGVVVFL